MSEIIPAGEDLEGQRAWCHVMYGLHALSAVSGVLSSATIVGAFVFGWPSIIAIILNYLKRGEVHGSWLESHWHWQRRTFWFAALWLLVAGMLAITLIGIPAAFMVIVVTGVWVLYRVIRGWMVLAERQPLPELVPLARHSRINAAARIPIAAARPVRSARPRRWDD